MKVISPDLQFELYIIKDLIYFLKLDTNKFTIDTLD